MQTTEKSIIRSIIEKDGKFFVSFPSHPSYFKIPPAFKDKLLKAEAEKTEVTFTFDRDMNITKIA